jgi:two-component system response regulator MprA
MSIQAPPETQGPQPGQTRRQTILVIDDEPLIGDFLRMGLGHAGYAVEIAMDGQTGIEVMARVTPSLIVLDLRLPDMDGLQVCRQIRFLSTVPVLVLTARDTTADKIALFNAGADDYLVKPFDFDELLVRIRALLRRAAQNDSSINVLRVGDVEVQLTRRVVTRAGRPVDLTPTEFELLAYLLKRPSRVVTRAELLRAVWNQGPDSVSNVVDVFVGQLRRKLGEPEFIQTVRAIGYLLRGGQ